MRLRARPEPDDASAPRRDRWLPWPASGLRDRLRYLSEIAESTRGQLAGLEEELLAANDRAVEVARVLVDREAWARQRLHELRREPDYLLAYTEDEPLVSIVIPTFENHQLLRARALPSALAQTYERIEVIVVGDAAPDEARRAVESIGDPRVSFHNRTLRGPYPDDPFQRWTVAGVPPYNEGVALANGRWIAPLDDDDAFSTDHVEKLLEHARSERAELAYGLIRQFDPRGESQRLGGFPPELGQFNIQASIYHAGLSTIFELELSDAIFGEPYDWSLCRRMLRAGVRIAMLDEEVVEYYPSAVWKPRPDIRPRVLGAAADGLPEWEVAREGWDAAREAERGGGKGWDVEAVAQSYARKWPEFLDAIAGPGPLGVPHEVPEGVPMPRNDLYWQNIILAYGHALASAARRRDSASVLDWGGALGHYYELGRRLFADLELDYHCRELPAVCRVGRELVPDVTFHDSDDCLGTRYDLVMASGSLQYEDDPYAMLERLAAATDWLYVTRLPVVRRAERYVARQRAERYGYETEYVGWVLNHGELLAAAQASGLALVREYILQPPMSVAGAPEDPEHVGLLFATEPGGD